jgi:hypothetical protein
LVDVVILRLVGRVDKLRGVDILRLVDNVLRLLDLAWLDILYLAGLDILDGLLDIGKRLWLDILDRLLDIGDLLRLDIGNRGLHWLLDQRLGDSGVRDDLGSLHRLVVDVLFDSLLGDHIDFDFLSDLGDVFGDVFDLLVVSVDSFDRDVVGLCDGLVLGDGSGDGHVLGPLLGDLFDVLALVGHLDVADLGFVVGVGLLDRDVLDVRLGLRLGLLVHGGGRLDHGRLGLHDRLNQGVLHVLHRLLDELGRLVDGHLGNGRLEDWVLRHVARSHFFVDMLKIFL